MQINFRPAQEKDIGKIASIEAECFPEDEAESDEILGGRVLQAPGLFLLATRPCERGEDIVGFMCGTLTTGSRLTKACMAQHEPDGGVACIHSVCITKIARGQGLANKMVKQYIQYVQQTTPQLREIRLLSKKHLMPWYTSLGFQLVGPSPVVHGRDRWTELVLPLTQKPKVPLATQRQSSAAQAVQQQPQQVACMQNHLNLPSAAVRRRAHRQEQLQQGSPRRHSHDLPRRPSTHHVPSPKASPLKTRLGPSLPLQIPKGQQSLTSARGRRMSGSI